MKTGKPQMTEEMANAIIDVAVEAGNGMQTPFNRSWIFAY